MLKPERVHEAVQAADIEEVIRHRGLAVYRTTCSEGFRHCPIGLDAADEAVGGTNIKQTTRVCRRGEDSVASCYLPALLARRGVHPIDAAVQRAKDHHAARDCWIGLDLVAG